MRVWRWVVTGAAGAQGAADTDGLAAAGAAVVERRSQVDAPACLPLVQDMLRAQGLAGSAGKVAAK